MDVKQFSEKRFALLIDADNVSSKYIKPLTDELSKYGTVTIKRIYGDWTLTLHAKWKDTLLENSITPIQQFGYTQGKNATDSAMIIDAMDILYGGSVDGFCIVSSDSDFTRLASRIRESGLTVIGMGEKKTPVPFRKACDIFTTLELLLPSVSSKPSSRSKGKTDQGLSANGQNAGTSIEEIEQAVINIITDNQNNGKSTGLGEVGSRLLKRYPDFDVRSYGTNQLKKLLDEFKGVIVTKDGSSVAVELAEEKDAMKSKDNEGLAEVKAATKFKSFEGHAEVVARQGKTPSDVEAPSFEGDANTQLDVSASQPETIAPARKASRRGRRGGAKHAVAILVNSGNTTEVAVPALNERQEQSASVKSENDGVSFDRQPRSSRAASAAAKVTKSQPEPASASFASAGITPDRFIRQLVRESGAEGVAVSALAKSVRARFRSFKVRNLGYTQFRSYVADLGDIEIEKRGAEYYVRFAE